MRVLCCESIAMTFVVVLLVGCIGEMSVEPADTATLAEGLRNQGVAWATMEAAPQPKGGRVRFDEAITLKGTDLWVDLIRIDDQRVYDMAKSASHLLTMTEAVAGQPFPGKPKVYTRDPFIIVVRQEPAEGGVLAALNKLMPATE